MGGHDARLLQHLLRAHFQLILHVHRGSGDEEMDARVCGVLHGVPGAIDILVSGAGKRGHGAVLHGPGDFGNGFNVAGGGDGEAGLDYVHLQAFQALGNLQLFFQVHAAAGGLLTIAQGGIENLDLAHVLSPFIECRRRFPALPACKISFAYKKICGLKVRPQISNAHISFSGIAHIWNAPRKTFAHLQSGTTFSIIPQLKQLQNNAQ